MISVLVTSTSFQDQPGSHMDRLLGDQRLKVEFARGPLTKDELRPIVKNFDAIICGDDEFNAEILALSKPRLKILSKYGVGLDSIDLNAAKTLDIKVTSCAGVNSKSVAEHVFALLLAHAKNIESALRIVRNYQWQRPIGFDLKNKRLLLIGFGNIGKEVKKRAESFEMQIGIYDPFAPKPERAKTFTDIVEAYIWSQIISLHCPLNTQTLNLINLNLLQKNKDVILINTARGGLVNEGDVITALNQGLLSAYLADVLVNEPVKRDNILPTLPKVAITPHIASRTQENIIEQANMALDNLYKELHLE